MNCLSSFRFERTTGVQNDETEDGEVETTKREKSTLYPKGDPLELINRGGTTPIGKYTDHYYSYYTECYHTYNSHSIETTRAIMAYLTKLMTPAQLQPQPQLTPSPPTALSSSPPSDKKSLTKTTSEDVTTKKSSVGKSEENEPSPKLYERGHSTPKRKCISRKLCYNYCADYYLSCYIMQVNCNYI